VVAFAWLGSMFLSAIPFYLSGHFTSYLDACFEAMSGFATTGLTLIQDLDHLALSYNMWRHLIMFVGGQGIIVVALLVLGRRMGAFRMYLGEGREEKILPNILQTAKFIWLVSFTYLSLASLLLGLSAWRGGMPAGLAFLHGLWVAMAGWDTGGFAPQSQNILFYHNLEMEIIIMITLIIGAMSFALHYVIWSGRREEIYLNLEIRTFLVSIFTNFFIVLVGLISLPEYASPTILFRKGFFHLLSAHTGTGYTTLYPAQFASQWPHLSLLGLIVAMAISGCACSTTGGIKALRVGIIFKAFSQNVKNAISVETNVFITKFHHLKNLVLEDSLVKYVFLTTFSYLGLFLLGTILGTFYGYPFLHSLFESVSAAANIGLSCGITSPQMPSLLKIVYIFQMWAGRLEFISIFALFGLIISLVSGKK
jgi:trk system potassium uptake protein TrkH